MGMLGRDWQLALLPFLLVMVCVFFVLSMTGCDAHQVPPRQERGQTNTPIREVCTLAVARYPTTLEAFSHLYANRGFYVDGNHLGRDIDLPEGTAVHPIACGTVRIYRAAQGYGTLAVVLEHVLPRPFTFKNGMGETVTIVSFLTIYGHLRKTPQVDGGEALPWEDGDVVTPDDVIGYVQTDALNGDGNHHVHVGVRLQGMADAMVTDANWFRGYDTVPSERRWFADPADFVPSLIQQLAGVVVPTVRWHPAGTVLRTAADVFTYLAVMADDTLRPMSATDLVADRREWQVVPISVEERNCYTIGPDYERELLGVQLVKFADASAVYEIREHPTRTRRAFVSYEAFRSWGFLDAEIQLLPVSGRAAIFANYADAGLRRMRPGTLVKGRGQSEVAIVTETARLPFQTWDVFLALGFREQQIVEIDPATLEANAGPRGSMLTPELVSMCRHPSTCVTDCPDAGRGGGTGELGETRVRDAATGVLDANVLAPDQAVPAPDASNSFDAWDVEEVTQRMDAGTLERALADAMRSPTDATQAMDVMASPDALAMDAVTPADIVPAHAGDRPLIIQLSDVFQGTCPGGYALVVWDDLGRGISSDPGGRLMVTTTPSWRGFAMASAFCRGRPAEWGAAGRTAQETGFASIRLGDRDLAEVTRLCRDPFSSGVKVAIPLEPWQENRCPP